jgi:hypothetical protein
MLHYQLWDSTALYFEGEGEDENDDEQKAHSVAHRGE